MTKHCMSCQTTGIVHKNTFTFEVCSCDFGKQFMAQLEMDRLAKGLPSIAWEIAEKDRNKKEAEHINLIHQANMKALEIESLAKTFL